MGNKSSQDVVHIPQDPDNIKQTSNFLNTKNRVSGSVSTPHHSVTRESTTSHGSGTQSSPVVRRSADVNRTTSFESHKTFTRFKSLKRLSLSNITNKLHLRNSDAGRLVLRRLDSETRASKGSHGSILVGMRYSEEFKVLLVKVTKCKNLRSDDCGVRLPNSYVKLRMLPSSDDSPHHTRTVDSSISPNFNEIFSFKLTEENIENFHLNLQVWTHYAMQGDHALSEVDIKECDFTSDALHKQLYPLSAASEVEVLSERTKEAISAHAAANFPRFSNNVFDTDNKVIIAVTSASDTSSVAMRQGVRLSDDSNLPPIPSCVLEECSFISC